MGGENRLFEEVKREKIKEKVEVQVDNSRGNRSRFIESLAKDLRPSV